VRRAQTPATRRARASLATIWGLGNGGFLEQAEQRGKQSREYGHRRFGTIIELFSSAGTEAAHAVIHLVMIASGHDHHATADLAAIIVPAGLALYSAFPNREERHA
jgi:hypothetical protein